MTRKSVLRSVRLDDDVWAAIKELDVSLNQYLRTALLWEEETATPEFKTSKEAMEFAQQNKIPAVIPVASRTFKSPLLKPSEKKK